MRRGVCIACLLAACGADAESAPRPPAEEPAEEVVAADPAAEEVAEEEPAPASGDGPAFDAPPTAAEGPAAPEEGCEAGAPVQVFAGDAWPAVVAAGDGFVVAGVTRLGDGEHAFAARLSRGSPPRLIGRHPLEADAMRGHRRAGPALAAHGASLALVYPDGDRHIVLTTFETEGRALTRPIRVADGGSLQFAPALGRHGSSWWIAWTEPAGEGRRVLAARVANGRVVPPVRDLSPPAGGGASPSFVRGAEPLRLAYVDAREALSAIHRVGFDDDALGEPALSRSLSLLTDPPQAVAFRMRGADWLLYTGIGSVATTALGLVPIAGSQAPVAVVPGTGYGLLYADAAPFGDGAVIAADVPTGRTPDAPREVQLRAVAATGALGPALTIRGPRRTAARVRVAVSGADAAVAFADQDGAYVTLARCAPLP